MPNLNKVLLMGRLTRDVKLTFLPSQTPVAEFGIATSKKFKKQDGATGEDTCFVDCRLFGKRAEVVNQYFKKGDPIFVEGRLQLDQWKDKEGKNQSRIRIFVENFEFVGGKQDAKPPKQKADVPELGSPEDDTGIPF